MFVPVQKNQLNLVHGLTVLTPAQLGSSSLNTCHLGS